MRNKQEIKKIAINALQLAGMAIVWVLLFVFSLVITFIPIIFTIFGLWYLVGLMH